MTSPLDRVRIEVEPKRVPHTSPETLAEGEKIFISKYPSASAPTESIAIAASPRIFEELPPFKSNIAQITVIGSITTVWFVNLSTAAIAIAPKAT